MNRLREWIGVCWSHRRVQLRSRLRKWLFVEETGQLELLIHLYRDVVERQVAGSNTMKEINDNGLNTVKALVKLHDLQNARFESDHNAFVNIADSQAKEFALIQTERIADRELAKKRYDDLLHSQQEMEQKLDRLLALLETKAPRLQARAARLGDWNEVERVNAATVETEQTVKRS